MIDIKQLVRKNILDLKPYSSARSEFKGKAEIFLDANENPFGRLNRYPDPMQIRIKNKLSEMKKVKLKNIFIGNGSDEVIDLAFRIFCEPGRDKALIFSPTYGMYDVSANINNITLQKIPLTSDFQIDIEKTKPYFNDKNLKLIFICSPNNPTGNSLDIKDIEYILQNFNGIVIIDEAYIDFSKKKSFVSKIKEYNNLIVSQTFSKAWGLAGVRVGTAYANEEIIDLYNKVKPPYNISTPNQEAVIKALDNVALFEKQKYVILQERARLLKAFDENKNVLKIYRTDANFILIEVDDATELYKKLLTQKVVVRNRSNYVPNTLRITVGTEDENNQLLKLL